MPLRERTYRIEEEIGRIEQEREELAAELANLSEDNPEYAEKLQQGRELDAHLDGLEWADTAHDDEDVPAWGDDVDAVTLGGLTGGEYGRLEQALTDAEANSGQSATGAQRVFQVRAGTIDAPYLDESTDEKKQLAAVASLPVGFLKWAADRIDDLSSVGNGERRNFDGLVVEKQSEQSET